MNRVVIFLGNAGHGSGAERVLEYLLSGAQSRREEICLLSPPTSSVTAQARDLGYAWIPWLSSHDGMKQNLHAFRSLTRGKGSVPAGDLVHAWHTRGLEWAFLLGRKWAVPASGTLHDDPSPPHHQFGWLRKKIIRATADRLDGVAVVSHAVARRCGELGWNREPTVIPNGLPDGPIFVHPTGPGLRIGFMATGLLWKGTGMLPDLVTRTEDLPVQWNLFGSTTETQPILDHLSTSPRVRFFGTVPLAEALSHIDVLLHLSLSLDPYPTVLLEAARAGIPVIATTQGGSPEIVLDGQTGILVPPGDALATETAIRHLFGNPKQRQSMALEARQRFEANLGVERMVADYFAFWDRLRAPRS